MKFGSVFEQYIAGLTEIFRDLSNFLQSKIVKASAANNSPPHHLARSILNYEQRRRWVEKDKFPNSPLLAKVIALIAPRHEMLEPFHLINYDAQPR